ncbi:cancer/testis antigen family 47 member C1-like isoform X2 [Balaenoptera ricei]|uniref:cancer/testis antigen family 47 member C1-like isoform X2 n=1 Tax=Balaenoptera ricei TaxID=2746895 RepID=UPI0028BE87B9|nr:cancer/testis antigen family 47 member C1-like isoform X2 [Balaenoptera ricei]
MQGFAKTLLLGFGVPGLIDGDRGMHFTSQDTQRWALERHSVDLLPPYPALGCRTQSSRVAYFHKFKFHYTKMARFSRQSHARAILSPAAAIFPAIFTAARSRVWRVRPAMSATEERGPIPEIEDQEEDEYQSEEGDETEEEVEEEEETQEEDENGHEGAGVVAGHGPPMAQFQSLFRDPVHCRVHHSHYNYRVLVGPHAGRVMVRRRSRRLSDPAEDAAPPQEQEDLGEAEPPEGRELDSAADFKSGNVSHHLVMPKSVSFDTKEESAHQYENAEEEKEDGKEKAEEGPKVGTVSAEGSSGEYSLK